MGKAEEPCSRPGALAGTSSPEEAHGAEGAASGLWPEEGVCLTCRTLLAGQGTGPAVTVNGGQTKSSVLLVVSQGDKQA